MQNSQFVAFKKKKKPLSLYDSLCLCQQQADDRIEHTAMRMTAGTSNASNVMIIYTAQSKKHKKMMS